MTFVKTLVAGALVASTMALTVPTPASAFGVYVGPRGGVAVRVGPGYRGYRRPFVRPRVYVRPGVVVRRRFYR
ncbi:hypothetical protein RHAL1_03164 [Beijerinckiaceae bacterium RH AL1]|jgi:hypothetical protein|nr:hypothetical protein [Beijerinckiaceae bacterium]VVB48131.1 hypothetical protein RHCH11_RHCH11_03100 [Beijerinckiaceae bacterium RH CH11]VVB48209.1 hypothetical protein RHAL8_03096 [Beijerinckiaceae bacterium RH AL8]VVC56238.1 hypothetical protein RHAL1_03164 [Beijerinckiaceae bacterium RH AL1]